jgi:hypothetical protein
MAEKLIKIRFELDPSDWHGHGSETLWATQAVGLDACYQIENSPFFVRGISHLDVVKAVPSNAAHVLRFEGVLKRGGHSTYMLIVTDEPRFASHWKIIGDKKCSYESMYIDLSFGRRQLLSVDVPPTANLAEVYQALEQGEADEVWLLQEGYAHLDNTTGH